MKRTKQATDTPCFCGHSAASHTGTTDGEYDLHDACTECVQGFWQGCRQYDAVTYCAACEAEQSRSDGGRFCSDCRPGQIAQFPATDMGKRLPNMTQWIRDAITRGEVLYNIESVSRSGMSRVITLYTIQESDGRPELCKLWPDHDMTEKDRKYLGWQWTHGQKEIRAFRINGCGMDMVFALLDSIGYAFGVDQHTGESLGNIVRRSSI